LPEAFIVGWLILSKCQRRLSLAG